MDKKELLTEIFLIIDGLENESKWGGDEDAEGTLHPGIPDFDEAKRRIRNLIRKASFDGQSRADRLPSKDKKRW